MKHLFTVSPKKIAPMFVLSLLIICPILTVSAQSGTVVRAAASTTQPTVGSTLTVDITISSVQNLYGVDVTFNWNTAVLQLVSATSLLGVESHSGGVLHGTSSDPILVAEDNASQISGEYDLAATSVAPAAAFSGSGTIATVKFTVIAAGSAGLALQTELANYNPGGQSTDISHTDTADSVTAVTAGSSTNPISTPTTSPTHSSGPTSTPTSTPEFSSLTLLAIFIAMGAATIALAAKKRNNSKIKSVQGNLNNY